LRGNWRRLPREGGDVTLTREMIESEPAGVRLNRWVAETLGWKVEEAGPTRHHDRTWFVINPEGAKIARTPWPDHDLMTYLPNYSGRMGKAWRLFMEAMDRPFSFRRRFFDALKELARLDPSGLLPDGLWALQVFGGDFPLAICRAFLIASLGQRETRT
jgi:hypothetical protein